MSQDDRSDDKAPGIPAGALVLVADGGGARVLRNAGDERELSLEQVEVIDPAQLPLETPAGSQPPEQEGQEREEAGFAKRLARRLNDDALNHRFEHLVLLADAQTLGQIRPLLHKETRQRLLAEHAKNLKNAPLKDIQDALR
jgi:protein required for attachment to host cells